MADTTQLTTHELWVDGRQIPIKLTKTDQTTVRLTWTPPTNSLTYNGAIILLSEDKFNPSNFPIDGSRYQASSNWLAPSSKIGEAHVVAAVYGFFGDNIQLASVDITNVDPTKLYYASIHICSNVLQYYTVGSQSYPLESSRFDKQSDAYAGSIPSSVNAPENPVNGQVYFDASTNKVMIWNDDMGSWIQSSQKSVPTGSNLPIKQFQLFFNTVTNTLKFFNGVWTNCDNLNTRIKMGSTWAPFTSASTSASFPTAPSVGQFVLRTIPAALSAPSSAELKFYSLGSWFSPTPNIVEVFDGTNWNQISIGSKISDNYDPVVPDIGDFFYENINKDLMVWNGSSWSKADTEAEGTPSVDKVGVGTDGSYDERLKLIRILKHQLGYPQVCVELSEENFNIAIDNALDEFRRRADNAYAHRHVSFTLRRGQSEYYLNDPRDKTDKIVNVIKIHRVNMLGISSLSAETGLYAQAFFNQMYQGTNVDLLSIHLMNQLSETYEKIFAGNLVFTWDEASRQLMILRRINHKEERVVLEVAMERTEQELLLDRWAKQWLQGWAESELMEMLGLIRSKYGSLPGANGGITLNGDSLISMAETKQTDLLRQILDYEVGNGGVNFGNAAFILG